MRRARGERGQILPLVVVALVALLGIAAFSIDVAYAYYAKRQLQNATASAASSEAPPPAQAAGPSCAASTRRSSAASR